MTFRVTLDSALDEGQNLALQAGPNFLFDPSSIAVSHIGGGSYDVTATIPHDGAIGSYTVGVRLSDRPSQALLSRRLAVIFNPYNPDDDTYYPDPQEREEYLNNEHGMTYRGAARMVQSVRWYYAQFIPEAIRAGLYYVDKLPEQWRRDPVRVIRHLTACLTVQPQHPDGMMQGKWNGGFAGGTSPSAWGGSDRIIQQFVYSGFRTVRWAQCWVFAAVLNTVARALGFAIRQISNFDSAHEMPAVPEQYRQEIVRYWDRNSRRMLSERGQIWNFHSWNEVYLKNPKQPPPYDTHQWHVVDATPQEPSEGKMQLGPGPIKAVKDWRMEIDYDCDFVGGEVSARIRNLMMNCWGGCRVVGDMGTDPRIPTGTLILTKAPNSWASMHITNTYHNRINGFAPGTAPAAGGGMRLRPFTLSSIPDHLRRPLDELIPLGPSHGSRRTLFDHRGVLPMGRGVVDLDTMAVVEMASRRGSVEVDMDAIDTHTLNLMTPFASFENNRIARDENDAPANPTFTETPLLPPVVNNIHSTILSRDDDDYPGLSRIRRENSHMDYPPPANPIHGETAQPIPAVGSPANAAGPRTGSHVSGHMPSASYPGSVNGEFGSALPPGATAARRLPHLTDPEDSEIPIYRYVDSGIAMSLNVVPTQAGKPLDVYLVFSCTGKSDIESYEAIRTGTANPHRHIIMQHDERGSRDSSSSSGTNAECPEKVMISFRLLLRFADYTGREGEVIGDMSGRVVLRPENQHHQIFKFTSNDYLSKAAFPVPEFVRATVMATDHSTSPDRDIVLFGSHTGLITFGAVELTPSKTLVRTSLTPAMLAEETLPVLPRTPESDITVDILYENTLPFDLTNVTLDLSADNMGFEAKKVALQNIPAGSSFKYTHTFSAANALPGLHYYQAIMTTRELAPTSTGFSIEVIGPHDRPSGVGSPFGLGAPEGTWSTARVFHIPADEA